MPKKPTRARKPSTEIVADDAKVTIATRNWRLSDLHRLCAEVIDAAECRGIPAACYVDASRKTVVAELVGSSHLAHMRQAAADSVLAIAMQSMR